MRDVQVTYRFGLWLVEPYLNRISQKDLIRRLEPRTMGVLECLLANPGAVVTTDDLLRQVWVGRYAEPHMVAKRISQIRKATGDDAKTPKYIETVSKRGYRTIANVELIHLSTHIGANVLAPELTSGTPSLPVSNDDTPCVEAIGQKPHVESIDTPSALLSASPGSKMHRNGSPSSPKNNRQKYRYHYPFVFIIVLAAIGFVLFDALNGRLFGQASINSINTIAVLPLDNLSGDPAQQYIADGMTEEIITELSKLKQLHVISRTSVMRYKSDRPGVKTIASDLRVEYIIEGSAVREAGRYRVTVQLIDAQHDKHIWAQSFDGDVSTILALRTHVAGQVASRLNSILSPKE